MTCGSLEAQKSDSGNYQFLKPVALIVHDE